MSSLNCVSYFFTGIIRAEVYGVSEVRISTSFPMSFDKKLFVSYFGTLVSSERHSSSCFELRWSISLCFFLLTSAILICVVQRFDQIFSKMLHIVGKVILQYFLLFFISLIRRSIHGLRSLITYITNLIHVKMKFCILFGNVFIKSGN